MSNLCVARDSLHKVKQTCTETNENCGNCMYTLGVKELCLIMVANRTLTIGCSLLSFGDAQVGVHG